MKKSVYIITFASSLALAVIFWHALGASGEETAQEKKIFPHIGHKEEPTCSACHTTTETSDFAGYPEAAVCEECHGSTEGVDLTEVKKKPRKLNAKFPHKEHSGFDCKDCHGEVSEAGFKKIGYEDCLKCHNETDVIIKDCTGCHAETRFLPSDHSHSWKKRHGLKKKVVDKTAHGQDCSACHSDRGCRLCHETTKPESHNSFFRIRGHGLQAKVSRDSCLNCHKENYCARCHAETKPLNHKGKWKYFHGKAVKGFSQGALGNCSACHKPSYCASCHTSK